MTELKTRRLAGIKKDTFEDLLKAAGIPAKYYCRRSLATWDVLLPSEDLAAKLAGDSITPKYFRLQPEYMERRRIKITGCNVPIQLNEEVLVLRQRGGYGHTPYFGVRKPGYDGGRCGPEALMLEL